MLIQGTWYDEGSAARFSATLRSTGSHYTVETEHGSSFSGNLGDVEVSDRLGNVERRLTLEDGSIFATGDNVSVDELFQHQKGISRYIHVVESHMGMAIAALIVTIAFSFAFFKWGVPWVSSGIAHALPYKAQELVGQGSFEFLDEYVFEESKVDQERQDQIRAHFTSNLIPLEKNSEFINYRLHFREWTHAKQGIPNALALPSGDIIVTDKFIELTKNQDEIDAVLLHEMGHVVSRHGLEMVIEGAIVSTAVMLASGDNSAFVDMGLGVGSLLVSSNYSRGHEIEADHYAFEQMLVAKIDPIALSDIVSRMTEYMEDTNASGEDDSLESEDDDNDLMDYLSSHPNTRVRFKQAMQYSECFQQGLIACDNSIK